MTRKRIFFSSDWHIGHQNVLDFSKRPFKDLDHMHQVLINNYNAILDDDSICYFLGDMGLCSSDKLGKVISQLKGTKVLILGNHDKKTNAMYSIGFDVVMYNATLIVAGEPLSMSHCPLLGVYREDTSGMSGGIIENWHGETRQKKRSFTVVDRGQYHIHGHIHSPNSGKSKKILGKQYDVGVDANGYRPVSLSAIESWIAKSEGRNGQKS